MVFTLFAPPRKLRQSPLLGKLCVRTRGFPACLPGRSAPNVTRVVRRRDRPRADGDGRRAEGRQHPGTSAAGHFTGTPTRSPHACAPAALRGARSGAGRPLPVTATGGVRTGMCARR
jgi:hypothetical protein